MPADTRLGRVSDRAADTSAATEGTTTPRSPDADVRDNPHTPVRGPSSTCPSCLVSCRDADNCCGKLSRAFGGFDARTVEMRASTPANGTIRRKLTSTAVMGLRLRIGSLKWTPPPSVLGRSTSECCSHARLRLAWRQRTRTRPRCHLWLRNRGGQIVICLPPPTVGPMRLSPLPQHLISASGTGTSLAHPTPTWTGPDRTGPFPPVRGVCPRLETTSLIYTGCDKVGTDRFTGLWDLVPNYYLKQH